MHLKPIGFADKLIGKSREGKCVKNNSWLNIKEDGIPFIGNGVGIFCIQKPKKKNHFRYIVFGMAIRYPNGDAE